MQVSRTLSGITAGAMLGIFVLGMTVPWLNAKVSNPTDYMLKCGAA
jgi:hypothetical protein